MSAQLSANAYGKSRVRLTRVTRHPDRHDLKELTIAVRLEGDFAMAYTAGDNSTLIATDSMKNTVYVLARTLGVAEVETFGNALARHFLKEYPQVTRATIELQESPGNGSSRPGHRIRTPSSEGPAKSGPRP